MFVQRPLGVGEGVVGSSVVCAFVFVDVFLDFRCVVLAVSFVFSPVPSTVSLVFLVTVSAVSLVFSPTVFAASLVFSATVSAPSLIFSPAFFAPSFISWPVPSCPNAASAPAATKARTRLVILKLFLLLICTFCTKETDQASQSRASRPGYLTSCSGYLRSRTGATRLSRAARPFVNRRKHRGGHAENIKRCDESIGKCQAGGSDYFIAARAYHNSLLAVYHAAVAMKPAKKFHIFHQRHRGKSTDINKRDSPAEDSVIATSHAEQDPCVMRQAVR